MKKIILSIIAVLFGSMLWAQNDTIIVDQIIARVGDEIILQSDVEAMYFQWLASGNSASRQAKCQVFEQLLIEKLLLNQAKIDSITVTEDELDMQVDARLQIYIDQLGGIAQVEDYLHKSIFDIKEDLKKVLKSQIIAQREREKITEDISITPSEVAEFYKKLPKDSLPLIDVSYEIMQIAIYPKLTPEQQQITIDKLNGIREKIVSGQRKFESMARMYSDDAVSAKQGGELGFMGRGELDPDFAAAAFALKKDEISPVIKTQYGYHIIQLIDRKGERVNVRHILIRPYIPPEAKINAINLADSIRNLIVNDSISFEDAAQQFSEDENSKNYGGYVFNKMASTTKFEIKDLPQNIKYDVRDMEEGEISKPIVTKDEAGNTVIKIYKISQKIPQHIANMSDDYQRIYDMALAHKKNEIFEQWVNKQQKNVYININPKFKDCKFYYKNWIKEN
jgi:peptidyl-prolyl cis-trans isomerase SurA